MHRPGTRPGRPVPHVPSPPPPIPTVPAGGLVFLVHRHGEFVQRDGVSNPDELRALAGERAPAFRAAEAHWWLGMDRRPLYHWVDPDPPGWTREGDRVAELFVLATIGGRQALQGWLARNRQEWYRCFGPDLRVPFPTLPAPVVRTLQLVRRIRRIPWLRAEVATDQHRGFVADHLRLLTEHGYTGIAAGAADGRLRAAVMSAALGAIRESGWRAAIGEVPGERLEAAIDATTMAAAAAAWEVCAAAGGEAGPNPFLPFLDLLEAGLIVGFAPEGPILYGLDWEILKTLT